MRRKALASLLVTSALSLHALPSRASEPDAAGDASIGTTPAAPREPAPVAAAPASPDGAREVAQDAGEDRPARRAYIATDPPGDWAVLHAGLRPHLGTFGGIATFAVAHARTERFYGAFSLSAIRNDAGTHVGLAQISLGRNLSDDFMGGAQVSLTENRARSFTGLAQTSLAYNRSLSMVGALQLSIFNRAKSFDGLTQVGGYNRADKDFTGIAQLGAFNHARGDFSGALQLGVVNSHGEDLLDDYTGRDTRFAGIAQIGVLNSAARFRGLAQVGAAAFAGDDFAGGLQIGLLGAVAKRFRGVAQVGVVTLSDESYGAQIGAAALALEDHTGLQMGVLANYGKSVSGAQLGLANIADEVRGVQIGVFNHAQRLRGLQIGLANHAEDGVLPWTAILNMGFGDGDGGDTYLDEERSPSARRAGATTRW